MTLESYGKFEEKHPFKKQQKFGEFWSQHSKVSKICTLIDSFYAKNITFNIKKYRGIIFHDTEQWFKFEETLTYGLENDMKNSANFHQSTQKSQNGDFDGILLSKVENVWA